MVGYALWFLTLTEVQPASIWVAPRKSPEVSFQHFGPSNNKFGDYGNYTPYCDKHEDYSCNVSGWSVYPKGCAFVSEGNIPTIQLAQAAGDGVFIPTVWGYEEVSVRPADGDNCTTDISSECEPSRGGGPPGLPGQNYYCNCKKNESFFIPWVVEQDVTFSYQMHLQIPDLDVMAAKGVNTPYCNGYLQKDQFVQDPPIWTGCKGLGQNDTEVCLRKKFYLSSMPCQVRLEKRPDLQGMNHGQKYNGPRYKDLGIDYFRTDLWGGWHLDVSRVLREVADFDKTKSEDSEDPFKCSFFSTGGSLLLQHFVEPFYPTVWHSWWSFKTLRFWKGIGQKVICRIGWLWLINKHHDLWREWPCFQVKIDITYLPFKKYDKTESGVDVSQISQRFSTTRTQRHRGLAILAQGGVGTVRQFSLTAIILGLTSLVSIWEFRVTILQKVISWERFCRGQASDLYRKALTQKVSLKRMVSAWVCRSVSALEVADRLATEESREQAARKIAEHLRKKFPEAHQDLEPFLKDFIENMIRDSLRPDPQDEADTKESECRTDAAALEPDSQDLPDAKESASPTDTAAGLWHANEVCGDVASKDITKLVEDGERWEDIIDPSFKMVAGEQPAIEKAHSFISGKSSSDSAHVEEGRYSEDVRAREMQGGYVQMRCCSEEDAPDDTEVPETIRIDSWVSQAVLRPGGAQ